MKKIVAKSLNAQDVVMLGGKPYLTSPACMKFAQFFGVSFKDLTVEMYSYEDEKGPVIQYDATVTATFQGREVTESGSASSADAFFNRKGNRLPLSEINRPNVRKKAITNAKGRATKAVLGLSFTLEELQEIFRSVGKDLKESAQVSYNKGGFKDTQPKGEGPNIKELGKRLMAMAMGDKTRASNLLAQYSKFKTKDGEEVSAKSLKEMTDKWAKQALLKTKKDWEAYQAENTTERNGNDDRSNSTAEEPPKN